MRTQHLQAPESGQCSSRCSSAGGRVAADLGCDVACGLGSPPENSPYGQQVAAPSHLTLSAEQTEEPLFGARGGVTKRRAQGRKLMSPSLADLGLQSPRTGSLNLL